MEIEIKEGGEVIEQTKEGLESVSAFEALERDFHEVLETLAADRSLDKFRIEYEKIHRALKRSHEHERKLVGKVKELNNEIVSNASKVHAALKLSQDDHTTIAALRKEIDKAWKMVETAQSKESKAKESVTQLREEIGNLSKLVEKGAKLNGGQESLVKELMVTRDELQRQAEEREEANRKLQNQLADMHRQKEEAEVQVASQKAKVSAIESELEARKAEVQREGRRRERLDRELGDMREKLDKKNIEQEELQADKEAAHAHVAHLEKQLGDARGTMDKYLRDYDALYLRTQKLTEDLEEQITKNQQHHIENLTLDKEIKAKKDEIHKMHMDKKLLERKVDREHKETLTYRRLLDESKTPFILAQTEIKALQQEIDKYKRIVEKKEKDHENLLRQAKLAKQNTQKAHELKKSAQSQVQEQERISFSLETEMNAYKTESVKQRKIIFQLENERERYSTQASEQRALYLQALEDIKLGEMRINELSKKITEWEAKLKQQQHLYESVRSDRNLYSKNYIEAQDEIAEMNRKFKILNHQIEQLKEEISAKDQALVKESFAHEKVEKLHDQQRSEISKMRRLIQSNDDVVNKQDAEIRRLASTIRKMDDEAFTQRKEYDQIINERDILGTQLIRRNDELALLYEKVKIQLSTLRKGEAQYTARVQDIQILRLKIRDLSRELAISRGTSSHTDEFRRDLIATQRELLQEKTKVKALSEELENPMNVHRWRKLEGSDPATYEMIQKIQTLQKRLIAKTEEVVEKDLHIKEKEQLYNELKTILARQPGPEVAEQLSVYQSSLRAKTRQLKAMASELNLYQAQVNEYKYEIERLTRELQDVKRKYYEQKRRDQLAKEIQDQDNSLGKLQAAQQLAAAQASKTRYTGGGFAIR